MSYMGAEPNGRQEGWEASCHRALLTLKTNFHAHTDLQTHDLLARNALVSVGI